MNEILIYLLKVSAAIALVTLPYYLVLRNDASLLVKRIYLVTGILLSWIFPLLSVRKPGIISAMNPVFLIDPGQTATALPVAAENSHGGISPGHLLTFLYLAGIFAFVILNLIALSRVRRKVNRSSGKNNVFLTNSEKVFTIYPNIFLPEKYALRAGNDAILIHERAHIRQLHMADLLICEFSLALTWFNPFSWLISRMIKENHEHLADREVLSQGVNPAHYKSLLLNHAMGGEVFRLGHQFNHSLTKKRFNMMKKMKAKKTGILKYMLFVPMVLAFTLMATAAGQQPKTIKGQVYLETTDVPGTGASVIIAGTTTGTVADKKGEFQLEVTGNPVVVISFVGFESTMVSAKEIARKPIILIPTSYEIIPGQKKVYNSETIKVKKTGKSSGNEFAEKKVKVKIQSDYGKEPVYVVDGKVVKSIDGLDPQKIDSINVFKNDDHPMVKKYNAESGLIMIKMKEGMDQDKENSNQEEAIEVEVVEVTGYGNKGDAGDEKEEKKIIKVLEKPGYPESGNTEKRYELRVVKEKDEMDTAQESAEIEEEIFFVVEDMPSFPGGREALGKYIDEHLEYPAKARKDYIAGKVMVEFKVRHDGSLENIRIAQSSNDIFNKAALAVFEDMPDWKPGKQRGKPVSCKVIVPVRFFPGEE